MAKDHDLCNRCYEKPWAISCWCGKKFCLACAGLHVCRLAIPLGIAAALWFFVS
jgi:hypothetical protein